MRSQCLSWVEGCRGLGGGGKMRGRKGERKAEEEKGGGDAM